MFKNLYSIIILSVFFLAACQEENEKVDSLRVAFQEFGGNLTNEGESANIMILSSKPAESSIEVKLSIATACGGIVDQFQIIDANGEIVNIEENSFSLSIAAGQNSNYFSVKPIDGEFPVGAVELGFFLEEVTNASLNDTHLNYNLRVGTGAGLFPENVSWDFEDQAGLVPDNFFVYNAPGFISNKPVRLSTESVSTETNKFLQANAFQGDGSILDTWLITTRRFDFRSADIAEFIIDVKLKFEGNGKLEFLWSDNFCGSGNPASATWNNLSLLESQIPLTVSNSYTTLTEEANEVLGKSVYFAVRFSEASSDGSAQYAIDNIRINSTTNDGGGNGEPEGASFSTDFEECSEDFAIPMGFNQVHVSDKTDRGWGCRGFGIDNSRGVQASAFSGSPGEVDAWLITFNSFDFSSLNEVNLQMQLYSNFSGPGQIEMKYSEDYSGSGSPENATWTSISQVNDLRPVAGSQEWVAVDVNVAELGGKEVYIAFHFYGASDEGSSSWAIDNLAINDPGAFDGSDNGGETGDLVTIAAAKGQIGSTVTISGIVTTPDYGATNGQYYVQDETGGINIIHFSNNGLVELGDEVNITGTVGEFANQTQIDVSTVEVVSNGNALPAPVSIAASDLSLASDLLGSRVVIANVSLIDATQWPTEPIAASSGVNVSATVNGTEFIIRIDRGESFYDGSTAPNGSFTLTGILGNYNNDVQIFPFIEGDVQ